VARRKYSSSKNSRWLKCCKNSRWLNGYVCKNSRWLNGYVC
jgi:hypothetical protein